MTYDSKHKTLPKRPTNHGKDDLARRNQNQRKPRGRMGIRKM